MAVNDLKLHILSAVVFLVFPALPGNFWKEQIQFANLLGMLTSLAIIWLVDR